MSDDIETLLQQNQDHAAQQHETLTPLQDGQAPEYVTVCCSDSRVLQDGMIGNDEPGQVFTVGTIGNRITQDTDEGEAVSGDVLYPLAHTGTKTAVVVGHTGCGAVTAAYESLEDGLDEPAGIQYSVDQIVETIEEGYDQLPDGLDDDAAVNHLVEYNVDQGVQALLDSDDVPEDVTVYGMVYDLHGVYDETPGQLHVTNINGERDPAGMDPESNVVGDQIERQWTY